jgi:hypothetical protein
LSTSILYVLQLLEQLLRSIELISSRQARVEHFIGRLSHDNNNILRGGVFATLLVLFIIPTARRVLLAAHHLIVDPVLLLLLNVLRVVVVVVVVVVVFVVRISDGLSFLPAAALESLAVRRPLQLQSSIVVEVIAVLFHLTRRLMQAVLDAALAVLLLDGGFEFNQRLRVDIYRLDLPLDRSERHERRHGRRVRANFGRAIMPRRVVMVDRASPHIATLFLVQLVRTRVGMLESLEPLGAVDTAVTVILAFMSATVLARSCRRCGRSLL